MNEKNKNQDDDIKLFDLFVILWHNKKTVIAFGIAGAVISVTLAIISKVLPPEKSFLPDLYTPKAIMLIDDPNDGNQMLGALFNSNALSSLSGMFSQTSGNSELAKYLMGTNSLLDSIVDEFDIINRYKIEKYPKAGSRNTLKRLMKIDIDEKSGIFTISFTDLDPAFARDVVNFSVAMLVKRFDELGLNKNKIEKENMEINIANTFKEIQELEEEARRLERSLASAYASGRYPSVAADMNRIALELKTKQEIYTQLNIQYELLKVTIASEKPPFQIVELAEIPDMKSKPGRTLLCIIITFATFFLGLFIVFAKNSIANIKNDPESMAKLKGIKANEK